MDTSGAATFQVDGGAERFRFKVGVEGDNMEIWLEDRALKKQWQAQKLTTKAFVTDDTAIPQAKLIDYANRFVEQLQATEHDDSLPNCQLSRPEADGSRQLRISLTLTLGTFEATLAYTFHLSSVPLEKVDIVEAKVRDLSEELAAMKSDPGRPSGVSTGFQCTRFHVHFTAAGMSSGGHNILWKMEPTLSWPSTSPKFAVDVCYPYQIQIQQSGVYMIHLHVAVNSGHYDKTTKMLNASATSNQLKVQVNNTCVHTCSMKHGAGAQWVSATLVRLIQDGDFITVRNQSAAPIDGESTMTVTQLCSN